MTTTVMRLRATSSYANGYGTVFKLNTDGTGFTVLKHFTGSDGADPSASLTLSGPVLYGTTAWGGSSNYGTVFKLNTDGTSFTVLKHFAADGNGSVPMAGLTLSSNVLYGTTYSGGLLGGGTVFRMNTDGTGYTTLKQFAGSDGARPHGVLTLSGSTLYGTTIEGGDSQYGTVFKVNTDGTGFAVLRHFTFDGNGIVP